MVQGPQANKDILPGTTFPGPKGYHLKAKGKEQSLFGGKVFLYYKLFTTHLTTFDLNSIQIFI